jgi:hypothetical protein
MIRRYQIGTYYLNSENVCAIADPERVLVFPFF